jgi:hypothetical protein
LNCKTQQTNVVGFVRRRKQFNPGIAAWRQLKSAFLEQHGRAPSIPPQLFLFDPSQDEIDAVITIMSSWPCRGMPTVVIDPIFASLLRERFGPHSRKRPERDEINRPEQLHRPNQSMQNRDFH